jgi:photosystem II stability/assembly factor-like uncharacterized protein
VALGAKGAIYSSTDAGQTWLTNNAPALLWAGAASAADGSKVYAVSGNGGIWTRQNVPALTLDAALSNRTLILSWTLPSTNFSLMQKSNLSSGSWVAVTNARVLNLDRLRYEVSVPASLRQNFFRLVSQ